jgi:hypothetical protein
MHGINHLTVSLIITLQAEGYVEDYIILQAQDPM